MGRIENKKKKTQKVSERERIQVEPPNQEILDSIGDPNIWTPEKEDAWLAELDKISAKEIYNRFPPCKKPPSVRKRGSGSGWGG